MPASRSRLWPILMLTLGGVTQMQTRSLADLCARYGLEMDLDSIPGLVKRFNLRLPGESLT